jgi:hypothetical protein
MLPITVGFLEDLGSKMANGCQFAGEEAGKVYDLMESLSDSDRRYIFLPGEGFDDFLVFCYSCNNRLYFVWKLYHKPFFAYPDYPEGVQSADISIDECRRVVAEFARIIDLIGEERPGVKAARQEFARKNSRETGHFVIGPGSVAGGVSAYSPIPDL